MTMESEDATPSLSQAQRMKKLNQSGRLDMDAIFAIMTEEKANQKETVKIGMEKLRNISQRRYAQTDGRYDSPPSGA